MFDEKKFKEIQRVMKKHISEGIIRTKQRKEHIDFFLTNAKNSLLTAQAIYDLSTNRDFQEYTGYEDINGLLWVVNASYYSMFYTARALLANEGIKLKSELSIHALVFDSMIYFFYLNEKLEKRLIQAFFEASEEASEILGKEKADSIMKEYSWEKRKRSELTYEIGEFAIKSKAKTSLERAKRFNEEIRLLIERNE